MEKKLTARELEFCRLFVNTGDAEYSAKSAGYRAESCRTGERLLCKKEVAEQIDCLLKQRERSAADMAGVGYRRLAFGNISDAVSLLYMDNPTREKLSNMDLFLVSEIKRPKDGSMEIKFFDRLKALEKLEAKKEEADGAKSLFDAIDRGARSVGRDVAGD